MNGWCFDTQFITKLLFHFMLFAHLPSVTRHSRLRFDFGCELMCFGVAFTQRMCHGSNCNYAAIKSCFWANKMCTRYLHIYHLPFTIRIKSTEKDLAFNLVSPSNLRFFGLMYKWITHIKLYINQDILLLLFPVVVPVPGAMDWIFIFDVRCSMQQIQFGNEAFIWNVSSTY